MARSLPPGAGNVQGVSVNTPPRASWSLSILLSRKRERRPVCALLSALSRVVIVPKPFHGLPCGAHGASSHFQITGPFGFRVPVPITGWICPSASEATLGRMHNGSLDFPAQSASYGLMMIRARLTLLKMLKGQPVIGL